MSCFEKNSLTRLLLLAGSAAGASFIYMTWLIHDSFMWDVTRSYRADSCFRVSRDGCYLFAWRENLIQMGHDPFVWYGSFVRGMIHSYVTWLIHMWCDSFVCDMTHSYATWLIHMWHDLFICDTTRAYVTWLIHMWHDSFVWGMAHSYATWLCDMTHSYVAWLIHTRHNS